MGPMGIMEDLNSACPHYKDTIKFHCKRCWNDVVAQRTQVQTRDESGELRYFPSVAEAIEYANRTPSVWKVSFPFGDDERVRLVRSDVGGHCFWVFEPIV